MRTAEDIMNEIVMMWTTSRIASRDAKLRIGHLVHEYILARFEAAADMSETNRYKHGVVRCLIIAEIGAKLGDTSMRVRSLVSSAMAVDLLGQGDCGQLSWSSVRALSCLVRRASRHASRRLPITERERWEIIPKYRESGPALFQAAIRDGMLYADVWAALRNLRGLSSVRGDIVVPDRPGPKMKIVESPAQSILRMLPTDCSPRDLAELLADVVDRSEQAEEVAANLYQQLKSRMARRGVFA